MQIAGKEKVLLLLSGGLDSVTLAHYIAKVKNEEVTGLMFHYGQEFDERELICATNCVHELRKEGYYAYLDHIFIDPVELTAGDESYNPARNLIFLAYATRYAEMNEFKKIYIGLISSEGCPISFPDATPEFVTNYNTLISNMYGMTLEAPFIEMNKQQVYAQAKWLGVKLEDTWSCNFPVIIDDKIRECGICANCLIRKEFAESNSFLERLKRIFP